MKSSMLVDFKILKRNNENEFVPMSQPEAQAVSIGGFSFDIGENSVPFDWDAFTGYEENGIFSFATGRGFVFNDYELSDCYDDDYKDMGLKKENISAEFLASAHHIEEFFVNFQDGDEEVGIGFFDDNAKPDAEYKLELIEISFEDMETEKYYGVKKEVLEAFNKGERGILSLDEQINVASASKEYELTLHQGKENEQMIRAFLTDEQVQMIYKGISGVSTVEDKITFMGGSVLEVSCIDAIEILDGDCLPARQSIGIERE